VGGHGQGQPEVGLKLVPRVSIAAAFAVMLAALPGCSLSATAGERRSAELVSGTRIEEGTDAWCTAGWWVKGEDGADLLMTAGHCVKDTTIWRLEGLAIGRARTDPGTYNVSPHDWGMIQFDNLAVVKPAARILLGHGRLGRISSRVTRLPVGSRICLTGATTGAQTCGKITGYNMDSEADGVQYKDMAETDICTKGGDSGGPIYGFDPADHGTVLPQGLLSHGGDGTTDCETDYQPLDVALAESRTRLAAGR
jgi:streptogrisin D